jgi:hypothetical protein
MMAAVGAVLLIGLLVFQVPRVMAQMNRGGAAPPPAVPTVSTPAGTAAPPSLASPTTATGNPSATGTSNPATGTPSSIKSGGAAGQLTSFSRFESKDPFKQQVQTDGSTATGGYGSGSGSGSGGGTTGSAGSGSGSGGKGTQPAPGSAVISVNGTLMSVTVGTDFPSTSPLFHLISLTMTTAKISIAGGSYSSGVSAVTLHANKPVTLMNTADGSRFTLILKPQGTAAPSDTGGTSTTSTTTTTTTTPSAPAP